jgi:hypothetical protein
MKNRMKQYYLVFLLLLFYQCNKADEFASGGEVEITLDKDTMFTESQTSSAVWVSIDNRAMVYKLSIKKRDSKGLSLYRSLNNSDLEEQFSFEYAKEASDEDWFNFIFEAYGRDNRKLASKILHVCTVEGIILSNLTMLARITGKTLPGEILPNPNRTDEQYNLGGADLGIIWDMENGAYGLFFGDSYGRNFVPVEGGGPGPAGDWRSNVLAFSTDTDLDDGLTFSGMAVDGNGNAREIAYSAKNTSGNGDYTSIPTAAIRADGVDYLHYMNIRTWTGWITNHSSLYASEDNGKTWKRCTQILFSSDSKFGQVTYAKKDGYVYMLGTPTGRDGPGHLARIPEKSMLKKEDYEYWNTEFGWVKGSEQAASVVFPGTVGEASLMYHKKFHRWIATYFDANAYALMLRDAPDITGPWSTEKVLARGSEYAQLYGSFMHPGKAEDDRLYFTLSQWAPYNVFLMRVDMKCVNYETIMFNKHPRACK